MIGLAMFEPQGRRAVEAMLSLQACLSSVGSTARRPEYGIDGVPSHEGGMSELIRGPLKSDPNMPLIPKE